MNLKGMNPAQKAKELLRTINFNNAKGVNIEGAITSFVVNATFNDLSDVVLGFLPMIEDSKLSIYVPPELDGHYAFENIMEELYFSIMKDIGVLGTYPFDVVLVDRLEFLIANIEEIYEGNIAYEREVM